MKKLKLIVLLLSLAFASQAQDCYSSVSLSIPNTSVDMFTNNVFPSVELGIVEKNVTLGLNVGRSNLNFDQNQSYYGELKTTAFANLGFTKLYILLGIGSYTTKPNIFIEYGTGLIFGLNKKYDFTIGFSNWDGITYLSPGLVYNFKL